MGGQPAGRHLAAGDALNELLFRALGVAGAQGLHLHVVLAAHQRLQVLDGVLLVGLHADDGVLQAEGLHQNAHAADDPLALLQHQPVVSGYVGLTLGAVQDQGIHLADAGADLHVGGEAGAAHSGDARLLDNLHDLLAAQLAVVGMGGEHGAPGVLEVILDDHRHHLSAAHVGTGLHRLDHTGHRRVNGGAQAGDLADLLAHLDLIAHGYNGLTGRTDMHCHGDDDLLGSGAQGRNLLVACQLFPVIGVHAAVKALLHRSTSQI